MRDKAFDNAKIPKYHGYQRDLACMVYKFFDKKISGKTIKSEVISNKESAEELHKPIIRTFKKQRVYWTFIDNIWGAGLADMQLIRKLIKKICLLLCVIYSFSKYAWVISFKDKKHSQQILFLTTSQGRVPPKSPGRPIKILFDHLGKAKISYPADDPI